jgi:hypothetical protein
VWCQTEEYGKPQKSEERKLQNGMPPLVRVSTKGKKGKLQNKFNTIWRFSVVWCVHLLRASITKKKNQINDQSRRQKEKRQESFQQRYVDAESKYSKEKNQINDQSRRQRERQDGSKKGKLTHGRKPVRRRHSQVSNRRNTTTCTGIHTYTHTH